ncbi:KTSC domain-containing protein [soil metagenome]
MPSSVIRRFSYDCRQQWLDVVFVTGRVYRYFDVPPELYESMRASGSKGVFFNALVRDAYRFERLRQPVAGLE